MMVGDLPGNVHATEAPTPPEPRRGPLGEPLGLWFLAFTEAWERFSFYGMAGLLPLYMAQALFLPPRIDHVAGFGPFRTAMEMLFGRMSTLGFASQVYGLFAGLMYLTPVFGGMIADRWIGRRRSVVIGAAMMSGGHVAMAFDRSFLLALALLICGCGLLKGNISAQVGQLYRPDDAEGRTRGFAIYSTAINIGAILGPLACGLLAQTYGWHVGFGAAGALMLAGLFTYIAGCSFTPADEVPEMSTSPRPGDGDARVVPLLLLVILLTVPQSVIFFQNTNAALIWIDRSVELNVLGFQVPVPWFNAIDPAASVFGAPVLLAWWKRQAARGCEPGELRKIAIGNWMAVAANLILLVACLGRGRVGVVPPILYDVLLGITFLFYWPTLLALVSRTAPARLNATMMGVIFLSLFLSYSLIGRIGGLYERMSPAGFWAMQVAIGLFGGIVIELLRRPLERALGVASLIDRRSNDGARASASP